MSKRALLLRNFNQQKWFPPKRSWQERADREPAVRSFHFLLFMLKCRKKYIPDQAAFCACRKHRRRKIDWLFFIMRLHSL